MLLVGNKKDLDHLRQISNDKMNKVKEAYNNIHGVFETSALTGEGINEIFQFMAETLLSI
jgi:Ni2+-binding GTPase involved in maturation of urease and hydrogenase